EALFKKFEDFRSIISKRLGVLNPNSNGLQGDYAEGYGPHAQEVITGAFLSAFGGRNPQKQRLLDFPKIPLPNWHISYSGLNKLPLFEDWFSSINLEHTYRTHYTVNGYRSLIRYQENQGYAAVKDMNGDFLPFL